MYQPNKLFGGRKEEIIEQNSKNEGKEKEFRQRYREIRGRKNSEKEED